MNDLSQVFLLLLAFGFKQLLCDYPFHPTFVLRLFQNESSRALVLHSGTHAFLTFGICFLMTTAEFPLAIMLAMLDFFIDFALAIFRARSELIARFKPLDLEEFMSADSDEKTRHRLYWLFYGLDRLIHSVTYIAIVFILCQQGLVWMM